MTSDASRTTAPAHRDGGRQGALRGARDILPSLAGVLPLAVAIGVATRESGVDVVAAWAASFLMCAGTAQLTAIHLLAAGTMPLTIVATTMVINSRFVVYSAGLARWFADEPLWRRLLLAVPLVDQLFVVCQRRFDDRPDGPAFRRWYYTGAAGALVAGWSATQAVTVAFAGSIPRLGALRLAAPLALVGLLVGSVRDRAGAMAAALTGAAAAVAAAGAPHHLNLVAGITAGVGAGLVVQRRTAP